MNGGLGRKGETEIECPFCGKGDIDITYVPPSVKVRKGPWGGSKPGVLGVSEVTIIHTSECPNCGKTRNEIKNGLEGKEIDHKKVLERLKKQGLPTQLEF